nr:MAG TPA: hypothetical protein [Caudoviricetes sp.]
MTISRRRWTCSRRRHDGGSGHDPAASGPCEEPEGVGIHRVVHRLSDRVGGSGQIVQDRHRIGGVLAVRQAVQGDQIPDVRKDDGNH